MQATSGQARAKGLDVFSSGRRARGPGIAVEVRTIERGAPFHDTAVSADVNRRLAGEVRAATPEANELPVDLAGSCNAARAVLAGFEHARCGAVWRRNDHPRGDGRSA